MRERYLGPTCETRCHEQVSGSDGRRNGLAYHESLQPQVRQAQGKGSHDKACPSLAGQEDALCPGDGRDELTQLSLISLLEARSNLGEDAFHNADNVLCHPSVVIAQPSRS